jgi:hypothetical protein
MLYFVKNSQLHRYPQPRRCTVPYQQEQLRDTIPCDVNQCLCCMRWWPGETEQPW